MGKRITIDHVIISQKYMETIKSMEMDEERQYRLYRTERQNKQIKKTYSDHKAILMNIGFISPKKRIARKRYKKYQTIIQENKKSKILEKGELPVPYNTRLDEVEIIKQVKVSK